MSADWMDILTEDQPLVPGPEAGVSPLPAPALAQAANPAPALPGMDAALDSLSEAQIRSEQARNIFEAQHEAGPWMDDYWNLIGEGWSWRQAVYMLWEAQPAARRRPRYQKELATEVLGLTSDRVISEWKSSNPAMITRVKALTISALEKARASIIEALIASATNANPRNHADRKLALEMTGDYTKRHEVGVGVIDLEQASAEELASMAQLPEWSALETEQ